VFACGTGLFLGVSAAMLSKEAGGMGRLNFLIVVMNKQMMLHFLRHKIAIELCFAISHTWFSYWS